MPSGESTGGGGRESKLRGRGGSGGVGRAREGAELGLTQARSHRAPQTYCRPRAWWLEAGGTVWWGVVRGAGGVEALQGTELRGPRGKGVQLTAGPRGPRGFVWGGWGGVGWHSS